MTHRYFQNQFVGADDTSAGDATELKWELVEDLGRCFVSFPFLSVVEPSRDNRGSSILGYLLLFWFRSRTLIVFWMMYV